MFEAPSLYVLQDDESKLIQNLTWLPPNYGTKLKCIYF